MYGPSVPASPPTLPTPDSVSTPGSNVAGHSRRHRAPTADPTGRSCGWRSSSIEPLPVRRLGLGGDTVLLDRLGGDRFVLGRRGRGRRRRGPLLRIGAAVLRRVGRRHAGLGRAGVVSVGDAVAVRIDERTAEPLRIGLGSRRRDRAGVVDVGNAVTVLVAFGTAGSEGIGVLTRGGVLALVFVIADAVAIGVGNGDVPGAAADVRLGGRLGGQRRSTEVVG